MSTTRVQLRTDALRIADGYNSSRWDTTAGTGEADRRGGLAHLREWKRLLNHVPTFRIASFTALTTDSSGNIALSSLSTGSADAQQNLYRVLQVAVNNTPYTDATRNAKTYLLSGLNGVPYRVWYRSGSNLVIPDSPNATPTGIWVNWTPTPLHSLSSDSVAVDLPSDDYSDVLAYEWAALLLLKGGAETEASMACKAIAAELRGEMLDDLRPSGGPVLMQYGDTAAEWGGI